MPSRIYTAPLESGDVELGRTLPSLLYDACERYENARAFNRPSGDDWEYMSLRDFRDGSEELALGLIDLGLERGDRVALYMESDPYFCMADLGCLIAGLVDVPIYLTHAGEQIEYVIQHSGSKALFVSDLRALADVGEIVRKTPEMRHVIIADVAGADDPPDRLGTAIVLTLEQVRQRGRLEGRKDSVSSLLSELHPHDLATIIYTSGTTGRPKGVMLTHENISANALTAFGCLGEYRTGADGETCISFLPLTHVFARTLQYGFMNRGTSVYFTTPENLGRDLQRVRPTIFATVPRVLEKVYAGILKKAGEMRGVKKKLLEWALGLAQAYDLERPPGALDRIQLKLADLLVFRKWREALGGRVRFVIAGGAALRPELTNLFAAAQIHVLQGYGLTETSPVISFNRPGRNRPGTIGELIPGVEVKIADDQEILTRGPHVMKGYFRDEARTREVIDDDGWFHTGDIGSMSDDGFLKITDRKNDQFKLSTGKFVMPQPLESRLASHPLVEQAVVVGSGRKFSAALIFPEHDALIRLGRSVGASETSVDQLVSHPLVIERFQRLVDEANAQMDPWTTIKRFALVPANLTTENAMLTPTMKLRRSRVYETFEREIDALYEAAEEESQSHAVKV
jgi:long-chain acyl-CoA synthetase